MENQLVTLAERPELAATVDQLHHAGWPPFLRADRAAEVHWPRLASTFADLQLLLLAADGDLLAVGHMVPLCWDGTGGGLPAGWDAALHQAVQGEASGRPPDTAVGLAVLVAHAFRGQGHSSAMLRAMKAHAAARGLHELIVPVRPTLKSRYPLAPMERYMEWQREDGAPFDPWLRTHWRLGARRMGVAHASQVVQGTVAEWEAWTTMRFPESGPYVVPGALLPIEIDREQDRGVYEEPNVWVHHPKEET